MCALIKTIWWPWCRTMGSVGKSPESTWQRRKWMTVRAKLLFIRLIELRERTRYWNFSFFFLGKRWPGESFYSENGLGPWFSKSGIFSTKRHRKRKEATGERTSLGWRGTCRSTCRYFNIRRNRTSQTFDYWFTWSTIWMLIPLNNHLIWILIELKVNLSEINLSNGRLVT